MNSYIQKLAASIDRAVEISLSSNRGSQHVFMVSVVRGVPFYGAFFEEKIFLQVFLFNPNNLVKVANMLRNGVVMSTVFEVFEVHIPFLLKFMIDYNLFGMSQIKLARVQFRQPLPTEPKSLKWSRGQTIQVCKIHTNDSFDSVQNSQNKWNRVFFDPNRRDEEYNLEGFEFNGIPKTGFSELELDASVEDILNLQEKKEDANVQSLDILWEEERRRLMEEGSNIFPKMPSNVSRERQPYSSESKMRKSLDELLEREAKAKEQFLKEQEARFAEAKTEQVEIDFLPSNLPLSSQLRDPRAKNSPTQGKKEVQVEERMIFSQAVDNETMEILEWMQDAQEVEEDREEDEKLSQKEMEDIVSSNRVLIDQLDGSSDNGELGSNEEREESEDLFSTNQMKKRMKAKKFVSQIPDIKNPLRVLTPKNPPPPIQNPSKSSNSNLMQDYFRIEEGEQVSSFNSPRSDILYCWTPREDPPSIASSSPEKIGLEGKPNKRVRMEEKSQIEAASFLPTKQSFKFKLTNSNKPTSKRLNQHFCIFSFEIFASTRGDLLPNPQFDPLCAIFYSISDEDVMEVVEEKETYRHLSGFIAVNDTKTSTEMWRKSFGINDPDLNFELFQDEFALFRGFIELIRYFDPDMLLTYDVKSSLGFLVERGNKHGVDLTRELSRILNETKGNKFSHNKWTRREGNQISVTGRILLDFWRIVRGETQLNSYSYQNAVFHILHQRTPFFSEQHLTNWYNSNGNNKCTMERGQCVFYFVRKTLHTLEMLEKLELVKRTSELAKILGLDFFSVLSRGSQFRVESLLLRITKKHNFILHSPSREQVNSQKAVQCIPLVLEPLSSVYTSPVLVLDFQSLYPSLIIAYNLCFSTCLGGLDNHEVSHNKKGYIEKILGTNRVQVPLGLLNNIGSSNLFIAPNGSIFVTPKVRKGLLPCLLTDILEARKMIKEAMKRYAGKEAHKHLYHLLDAQQLALKLTANVTYGYVGASFSGRMPCVDVADAIVSLGRKTLESAISYVSENSESLCGAKVVYGDTDSLFVNLPAATKEEAFKVGAKIAEEVSKMHPSPVKLKFEKVYMPCALMTKKRYVGHKFESPSQQCPEWEAKGLQKNQVTQKMDASQSKKNSQINNE